MKNGTDVKQLRSFGLIVGGIFAALSLWPIVSRGEAPRLWMLSLAGVLIVTALVSPKSLKQVHQIWMAVGHILGWINTRILLCVVFYMLFTPMGLFMRLIGKDPLCVSFDPDVETYRLVRQPRPASHMTRQF